MSDKPYCDECKPDLMECQACRECDNKNDDAECSGCPYDITRCKWHQ